MTDKQKEYIFGGGAQPLDACLRVKWHTHMGGLAGVQKAIADKTIPDAILAIINYKTDGSLSWRTNLTEQEASDAITAFKDVLNVGDKKDPTATLKAFWAFCNQIGVSKDDVHMFYRVPLDDGALKDYVKERAGDLKTTQMAVWSLMRTEVEKAHAENKLHVAPEETAGQPADIPFG